MRTTEETTIYIVAEVAEILHTNVAYVHRLRKSGQLKFMKLGAYKVRKQELDRFLAEAEGMDLSDPFKPRNLDAEE